MREMIQNLLKKVRLPLLGASLTVRRMIANSFFVRKITSYPLGKRILVDTIFRAEVSLHLGLLINLLYGAVQFVTAVCCRSVWLGALAIYHILLAAIRFLLMRHIDKNGVKGDARVEWQQYRLCGIVLLLMTPVFASIFIVIVHKNSHGGYPGFLIYIAAIYAFGKIGTAISSTVKFRNYGSPVLCAAKEISLIAALISILSLETAILSRYGNRQAPAFYQGMIGTVGGAICVFVLGKAIAMVAVSSRQLKQLH